MTDSAVDCSMPRLIRLTGPIGLTNAHGVFEVYEIRYTKL